MTDLRIADAPELTAAEVNDTLKLPTGGYGNYSITMVTIRDWLLNYKMFATQSYVNGQVSVVTTSLNTHTSRIDNPHQVTKAQVGLSNVDNTSDINKPVSAATQTALTNLNTSLTAAISVKANTADVYTKSEVYTKLESDGKYHQKLSIDGILAPTAVFDDVKNIDGVNGTPDLIINQPIQNLANRTEYLKTHNNLSGRSSANSHPSEAISYGNITQKKYNDGVESIAELLAIQNPFDGMRVYVKGYHVADDFALLRPYKGGGYFVYKQSLSATNNSVTIFNGWVRVFNNLYITPEDAGAKANGTTDDSDAIQNAVNVFKTIHFSEGTYRITKSIVLTGNAFEIRGVKGKTTIMGSGGADIYGYFQVNQQFYADFGLIEGITFDSDDHTKQRIAIHSTGSNYLTHWKISECNFNGRLTGGIIGNLIACHIYRCYFGVYFSGAGNNLIAIQSTGSVPDGVTTNINVIEQCEFSNCGSPTAIVDMQTGYKVVFKDCIFEQLTPTSAVILLSGIEYPVFDGCWFENAQGTTGSGKSVIWTRQDVNGIFCEVLTVNECLFHTYSTVPDGLINFSDSPRKVADFSKNFMINIQSPVVVGGNSVASFVNSYGNSASVGVGGDVDGLQYDSPVKFDLGVYASGITFPTSNANLNDYKQGTWIPTADNATLTQNSTARYTKIGRIVHIELDVSWDATADTSIAKITNLPISSTTSSAGVIGFTNYSDTIYCIISGVTATLSGATNNITNANMSGKRLILQATYSV